MLISLQVSASRLITSYAIPPQSSFSCAPISLRTRTSKHIIDRRTYAATQGPKPEITLFKDSSEGATSTESTTTKCTVENSSSPIFFLGTTNAKTFNSSASISDLLVVKKDGEIQCYDGSTLVEKWTSPATALYREAKSRKAFEVEFVHLSDSYSASQGILKSRKDVLTIFPQEITKESYNPEILIIVTKAKNESPTLDLHIVSLPRRSATMNGKKHSVDSLLTAELPAARLENSQKVSYSIQVSTGTLQELANQVLTTYDLTGSQPKIQARFTAPHSQTFVRLSAATTMVASESAITIYNQKYQSKLATLDIKPSTASRKRKRGEEHANGASNGTVHNPTYDFVAFFSKLGSAFAILDNSLVGIQIDSAQAGDGKFRAGLRLIDSIGSSSNEQMRLTHDGGVLFKKLKNLNGSMAMDSFLPCSIGLEKPWIKETVEFDRFSEQFQSNPDLFDRKIAPYLGLKFGPETDTHMGFGNGERLNAIDVDRRWVLFAMSRIFTLELAEGGDLNSRLAIALFPKQTMIWLMENGFMTTSNIETALKRGGNSVKSIPAGQLTDIIVELDPEMDWLYTLIYFNELGVSELTHALKIIMRSLGVIAENPTATQMLLTNGYHTEYSQELIEADLDEMDLINGDLEERAEKEADQAQAEIEAAEYKLTTGAGIRGEALSLVLTKLDKFPSHTVVQGLQIEFSHLELNCLIYLMRYQLAAGAWTTRYTDDDPEGMVDDEAELPNDTITLMANTLNNCVDAIGAGGWLTGPRRYVDKDPLEAEDFVVSLGLEISAALEGAQEAVYLQGSISEMLQYSEAVRPAVNSMHPIKLLSKQEVTSLPLGLKPEKEISEQKVGAGGAVYNRTKRDKGYLKSQKVGKYTRERIVL